MIDSHAHLPEIEKAGFDSQKREIDIRQASGITTCFSCGSPKEWEEMKPFRDREGVLVTFGVHPWFAHKLTAADFGDIFSVVPAIGEIGLDGFLSEAPLELQKKQLEMQLQIAADLHKPIVIHADGREKETEEMIRDFPEKILIHWYSGNRDVLARLLEKDCYFSLGPDTDLILSGRAVLGDEERHEARKMLVSEVSYDRLFVETDGLEAVAWARGEKAVDADRVADVLNQTTACFAKIRGITPEEAETWMRQNFQTFFNLK